MRTYEKRPLALLVSIMLALGLAACGAPAETLSASAQDSAAVTTTEDASPSSTELIGKPWVTSIILSNLPAEQPEAKDDIYTHYNYKVLSEHQESLFANSLSYATEFETTIAGIVDDTSESNHELDQLRIFYNQARDQEALKKAGLTEIKPYLDRIDACKTLDEFNALLLADDFPFSPFITSVVTTSDMRESLIVYIVPNLLFADPFLIGGAYYQDGSTPEMQEGLDYALLRAAKPSICDLMELGVSEEEATQRVAAIIKFEKQYGKHADYAAKYQTEEFGAAAKAARDGLLTLDEMCALSPNFPLKGTLEKEKKADSPMYFLTPECLAAFDECWTEENLDALKTVATLKIMQETSPYRDPSTANELLEQEGGVVQSTEEFAYAACNSLDTFSQVIAKTYVDRVLGTEAKDRITAMSEDLLDTYRDLISKTPWIGDESKASLIAKIDNMTLNILEPDGGYFDYSALELTPTEEGGTLFGNYLKLKQYRIDRESEIVGQPARAVFTWFAIAPTEGNAFYDPTTNSINIYPGYVTSNIYTTDISDTDLLATLGFVVGHEISHAFDYYGGQFDAYGSPTPVYVNEDVEAFTLRTDRLADYYSTIEAMDGIMVDGRNVVTEAMADLSGVQATLALLDKTDGSDFDRFCAKFSDSWALVADAERIQSLLATDGHPLFNLRINVNMQMFDMMYDALDVKEGDGMYLAPEKRIVVWGENAS